MGRPIRFVGLSTALANAHDLADWLGTGGPGLFNFKPSVRPVQLEAHMQGYPGGVSRPQHDTHCEVYFCTSTHYC
jgi:activating signal cointegrator complex subunit 3